MTKKKTKFRVLIIILLILILGSAYTINNLYDKSQNLQQELATANSINQELRLEIQEKNSIIEELTSIVETKKEELETIEINKNNEESRLKSLFEVSEIVEGVEIKINKYDYTQYRNKKRIQDSREWKNIIIETFEKNNDTINDLNNQLLENIDFDSNSIEYDNSNSIYIDYLVGIVQDFTYTDDFTTGLNEYPKYPIETLFDKAGDCEDTSILLTTLLKANNYDTVLIEMPGHMATGVRCNIEEINSKRELKIENLDSQVQDLERENKNKKTTIEDLEDDVKDYNEDLEDKQYLIDDTKKNYENNPTQELYDIYEDAVNDYNDLIPKISSKTSKLTKAIEVYNSGLEEYNNNINDLNSQRSKISIIKRWITKGDINYCYIETTGIGFAVGDIPDGHDSFEIYEV